MDKITRKDVLAAVTKARRQFDWVRVNGGAHQIMGPGGQLLGGSYRVAHCQDPPHLDDVGAP